MHNRSSFRTPFGSQFVNGSQTLLKTGREHIYPTYSLFSHTQSWRTSLLVRSGILGLFFNTLIADAKYSHHNAGNLEQPVQIHLS